MANFVFNVAKGRIREMILDGETFGILLLKASATDAVMRDIDTIQALLADAAVTEADFTNYARQALASLTQSIDDGNDNVSADAADVSYTSAGGTLDNTITDAIIYLDTGGSDATRVPLVCLDAAVTTNGNNLALNFNASGFFQSS